MTADDEAARSFTAARESWQQNAQQGRKDIRPVIEIRALQIIHDLISPSDPRRKKRRRCGTLRIATISQQMMLLHISTFDARDT
jgi:hypothetical protein